MCATLPQYNLALDTKMHNLTWTASMYTHKGDHMMGKVM